MNGTAPAMTGALLVTRKLNLTRVKTSNKEKHMATKKLKEYKVNVCRIGYGNNDLKVAATSEKEARKLALDLAGSLDFSEHDADYEIQTVVEIKETTNFQPQHLDKEKA
jgi:hypothetical protein